MRSLIDSMNGDCCGIRDNILFITASSAFCFMKSDEVYALLQEMNQCFLAPLKESEIQAIVRNGASHADKPYMLTNEWICNTLGLSEEDWERLGGINRKKNKGARSVSVRSCERISAEKVQYIKENIGKQSMRTIAAAIGVSLSSVSRVCRRYGLTCRAKKASTAKKKKCMRLFRAGMSTKRTAELAIVSESVVRKIRTEYNKLQRQQEKRLEQLQERKRRREEQTASIKELWVHGMDSPYDISLETGVRYSTVLSILSVLGIERAVKRKRWRTEKLHFLNAAKACLAGKQRISAEDIKTKYSSLSLFDQDVLWEKARVSLKW